MSDRQFAKIFESAKYGQILALADAGDDGKPALRWHVVPPGLGVCCFAIGFSDDDKGWNALDKALREADLEMAEKAAKLVVEASTGATS